MSAAAHRVAPAAPPSMAALFTSFDWASTPLGPRDQWPAHLKTIVALMLASPVPMVVLWGPRGLLLYNDGYAVICGERHPGVFGQAVLAAWPEAVSLNQRVLDTCLAGASLSVREEHLVLNRHGTPEDVWLTVDYAPLPGPDGKIDGIFATVQDMTERVAARRQRRQVESQLALAIEGAELGTWDYDYVAGTMFWSDRLKAMFGLPPDIAATQAAFRAVIHPDDVEPQAMAFGAMLDPAIRAPYNIEFRIVNPLDGAVGWIATNGKAYFDAAGRLVRAAGTSHDITPRKTAERRTTALVELSDRLRTLDTTAAIAQAAAEIIGRALGASRTGYAVIDGEFAYVESDWTDGQAVSLAGARKFGVFGDRFTGPLRAGQTLVIEDVTAHPATAPDADAFIGIGCRAVINAPLLENGRIAALFYIHQATRRRWAAEDIQLAKDVVDRTWEASGRARSAQALRRVNEWLEQEVAERTAQRDRMWRLSSDVMLLAGPAGLIQSVNPAWTAMFGWAEAELVGRNLVDLAHPDERAALRAALQTLSHGQATAFEGRYRKRDGNHLCISWRAVSDGSAIHAVGRDVTAEREQAKALQGAEEALRQAQKMEAVGRLTGGIAHDFNNLLQGITGSLDLVDKRLAAGRAAEIGKFVLAARQSADRAVALTHRLLAFSRRQPLAPKPVEANPLAASMEDLLRRTMGERISVELDLAPDLWLTLCDPHQLESAILNLAINARDAMPDGGRLLLATRNTELAEQGGHAGLKPGPYVCVSVTDTGTGMTPDVIAQAFEPFFTTKPLGQGTGLGLSMIFGFARQSEGDAQIHSQAGKGTTVKLLLPRYIGGIAADEAEPPSETTVAPARHASVLVLEDEDIVRGLVVEVLDELGLPATEAADGPTGLEILQSKQAFDLLITDIGLPGLNGRQIAEAARQLRPTLKILFMTGYAETAATAHGFLEPGMEMITKPFAIDSLSARIRAMLEG